MRSNNNGKGESFSGHSVAIITPFKNGVVDYESLEKQVQFQIDAGTTAVVPVGTTGESPTLSYEEHEGVIRAVVKTANGKIKVIAGTGSNSTDEAVYLTQFAEQAGADAALLVAPYYNKPTQEGFYMHYKTIAEKVGIPICIYNIPSRCGKNIEPETIIRLAEIPNITMVKEATGSMDQTSWIVENTNLTVLSGDDSLTLPIMSLGGRGVISVVGNIVPDEIIKLCKTFDNGDIKTAKEIHYKIFKLCRNMLTLSTNPIPIKTAMKILGRDTGELRLPLTPLTQNEELKLRETLTTLGLNNQFK
ncbi:MAG: 4-hydroxy-tetrahydrodipicolinate synthase [Planctomycetaceae bacterium]|jgi:4-hydroxy-tetrahydrodipicolinate synthase|nr:4-hydroxy-tetrahydrodipicolinate synthase [Planctomycetaceae bacterium]